MRCLLALPLLLAVIVPASADTPTETGSKRLQAVAPFLEEDTVAVAHLDLGRLDLDALFGLVSGKFSVKELSQGRREIEKFVSALKRAGIHDVYAVVGAHGFQRTRHIEGFFLVLPLPADADADKVKEALPPPLLAAAEKIGKALVVSDPKTLARLRDLTPARYPELAKGFAALGNGAAQVVVIMPKTFRRALSEALPTLPPFVGGGSSKVVTEGFSWAAAGVTLKPKLTIKAILQAKDADSAKALARMYERALQALATALAKEPAMKKAIPDLAAFKEIFTPTVKGNRVQVTLGEKEITSALVPMVVKVRAAAARTQSVNNLKQLTLAIINYADTYRGNMPAHAIYSKDGKPLLSWRVAILPFIEQVQLYKKFHLDEPWDSPHNKKLIARMPPVFRHPESKAAPGKTVYVVPVGKDTTFPPGPKGIRFPADIPDGTSNTLLIVEVDDADAVIWTKPADLRYDPQNPLKGLRGKKTGSFNAAYADGSVHAIPRTISLPTLRALFTRNGGEVLGQDAP
jgi:hypothetical protein